MSQLLDPVAHRAAERLSVPFHLPSLPDIDAFLVDARRIVESGRLSEGPFVRALEEALRPWVGGHDVVAVSSASDGLIAALALTAEPGCEVVIPGYTYLATWQAVGWAGMIPVVADVDSRGLLDPAAVEAAITPRTGAILAVHLTGALASMERLRSIADDHGLALVVDAAHAIGARVGEPDSRVFGDIEVVSLGATKQVAAGEGGGLAIRDPKIVPVARRWALQGHEPGSMDAIGSGMNLRLSELTGALALRQLDGLSAQLDRRAWIRDCYSSAWSGLPLRLSGPAPGERSGLKDQLVWVDDPAERAPLREHLAALGVETKPYYDVAIPDLTTFVGRVASADGARALAGRSFAVPIYSRLSDAQVERVVNGVCSFFEARGVGRG